MDRPRPTFAHLDRSLALTGAILVPALLVTLVPEVEVRVVAPGLDLVVDTVTTMATLAVAMLAWARFRDRGQRAALFQAAAFTVLALARAIAASLALLTLDGAAGSVPTLSGTDALYVSTFARLMAAGLLIIGGATTIRSERYGRPLVVMVLPLAALVVAVVLAPWWVPLLPPLVGSSIPTAPGSTPGLPHPTPANVLLQSAGAAMFAFAAALSRRRHRQDGAVMDGYLAVGLVIAAFAQMHLAFHPSTRSGVMASGDLLYLAFDVILLLGILAETRAHIVSLREANLGLERLKDAEVRRAAIEERARLSRELHDGLAQDLWLAKLKLSRLAALPDLAPEATVLCDELEDAVDSGLAEARQAVLALRVVDQPNASFAELMGRYIDDFGDRFGLRAEFACGDDVPRLATRAEAELLRIAQEALTNVRRHADATVVRVRVEVVGGRVVLTIRDNGRGFDQGAIGEAGFGLTSMRERAALIGARFSVTSRDHDGTCVTVDLPAPAPPAPAGGAVPPADSAAAVEPRPVVGVAP